MRDLQRRTRKIEEGAKPPDNGGGVIVQPGETDDEAMARIERENPDRS